jgi:LPXTG-site transpeptidase (sortase) family protein
MEVIVYQSPVSKTVSKKEADFTVSTLPAPKKFVLKTAKINFSKTIGYFLFILSICSIWLFAGPILVKELSFRFKNLNKNYLNSIVNSLKINNSSADNKNIVNTIERSNLFEQIIEPKQEKLFQPVDTDFGLVIPKININSKIASNIDITKNFEITKALKKGVAHASGSALPGQGETIYLFAHSAFFDLDILKMNAVFYQIKDLEINDEIDVYYKGKLYVYKVYGQRVVKPNEVASIADRNFGEQLVLQTCWPIGSTKERLLVFAKPVSVY